MRQEQLTNVPPEEVSNVVGGFISDGAEKVTAQKEGGGNWTVTANFDE